MPRSEKNLLHLKMAMPCSEKKEGISCLENPDFFFVRVYRGSGSFAVFGAALELLSLECLKFPIIFSTTWSIQDSPKPNKTHENQ